MPNNLNVNDISLAVNRLLDEAQGITVDGGGETVMIINFENDALDKTWNEIKNAMENGQIPVIREYIAPLDSYNYKYVCSAIHIPNGKYTIYAISTTGQTTDTLSYFADSPDDYPSADDE